MKKIILSIFVIFFYTQDVFSSNDILSTDEAVEQLLGSPDEAKIRIQKITDNLYLFFGLGGNIAVSIGDDDVVFCIYRFTGFTPGSPVQEPTATLVWCAVPRTNRQEIVDAPVKVTELRALSEGVHGVI